MFRVYVSLVPEDINTLKTLQDKHGVVIDKEFLKNVIYAIHEDCYPTGKVIACYYRSCAEMFFGEQLYKIVNRFGPVIKEVTVNDDGVITIWLPNY